MRKNTRRGVLTGLGALVVGTTASTAATAQAKDYSYLDPVFTTTDLSVRQGPGTDSERVSVAGERTGGRIFEGPEASNGYNWWKVQFAGDGDGPVTGWVAEDWLSIADFACPMTGQVTSTYWDCRDGCSRYHRAADFATPGGGQYVHAARGGTVDFATTLDGYGKTIRLSHWKGWTTWYAHLREFRVEPGEWVSRGDLIGIEGNTGVGTGAHLHFEVRDPNGDKQRSYYDDGEQAVQGAGVPRAFY